MTARVRRRRLAALLTAVALGAATACSSSGAVPTSGGTGQEQSLLDLAPVASEADLAAGPTAQAIKRGQILIGSSLDTPLLSQQNPTTGQTEGVRRHPGAVAGEVHPRVAERRDREFGVADPGGVAAEQHRRRGAADVLDHAASGRRWSSSSSRLR